jgi:predicted MarR family transcription regulator
MASMHNQGSGGENEQSNDFCWGALVARVLHPVDVQIIEALACVDRPLSMSDLAKLFNEELEWTLIVRHLRRLRHCRAITPAKAPQLNDLTTISYRLARHSNGG